MSRRGWGLLIAGAVIVLAIVLSALSGFYVDLLWFREVHFASVFWSVFWSKLVLGMVFGLVFFVLLLVNLIMVRRLTPKFRLPAGPEQEMIERYRQAFEPYVRYLLPAFSAVIAFFVGIAAAAQWQTFLLWRSAGGVRFGARFADPLFHRDPSFYIFILPFHKFVQGWLFSSLVGVLVIVVIGHYLSGNIRTQGVGERVAPAVRGHLSVLLGLIVLVKAWGYYLGKFDLLVSGRGVVSGASYTDIHAQKPALQLLMIVAIVCALLFLVNVRFRIWALPAIGIGLLIFISVVVGAVVPAGVQRFQVAPQELQKESPYIQRNIAGTRFAYGIDLKPNGQAPASDLTADEASANQATVQNIRLWNPRILGQTYQALQRIQPYYEFTDVDVDRYLIDGQERAVMLSAREVSQNGIPQNPGWQSTHLIYTHGYGAVASQVSAVTSTGAPDFVVQDVPPAPDAKIPLGKDPAPQVYYGELSDVPYVVAHSGQRELNYPNPSGGSSFTTYQGKGGIEVGNFFRRIVLAYRYRDFNLLISGLIHSDSKILLYRDIRSRIRKAAPFLKYDGDPYVTVLNGHIFYVWDAYTTTDLYPYSQRVNLSDVTNGDMSGRANYVRNSVKAVMNAYDGTVRFYVVDPSDPLIRVWEQAFPHLFTTVTPELRAQPIYQALQSHFRYPEDLLQIQAEQYARYHVTDPATFFNNAERWQVPGALSTSVGGEQDQGGGTLRPYYVIMKLPTESQEQFFLFEPFTPANRQNMVAYVTADSDPSNYGRLTAVQFPAGENVLGPQQVRNLLSQDPTVSSQITLLNREGSAVNFGDLLIVPIENSFLYVQPIFVTASGTNPIPELKRVVVVHGGNATIGNTLAEALDASFGQIVTPPGGGNEGGGNQGGGPPSGQVAQLLAQAQEHFAAAEQALKDGDLATYQKEIEAGIALVQQAQQLAGASPSPTPTPSATPSG